MAGILDEVMDGINAKEKQGQTPPVTPPATPPALTTPPGQEQTKPAAEGKPVNTYSDDFKEKYGEKNEKKATEKTT